LTFQYPCSPLTKGGKGAGVGGFDLLAVFVKSGAAIGIIPISPSKFTNSCACRIPTLPQPLLIRVQRFGTESPRQGRFFPARAWEQAQFFALTPCVPLCRAAGERGRAPRCAPLHPSPTAWERGWG
jgi:hypothetical protein